uniref:Putative ovule protein n=1 Tax=Solanum chacoense TaxID=4108 RepID=A0A0V0GWA9_SOLCH
MHLNFNLDSGICCRDICHFRCVMILVKVGQVITEEIGVMPISLLLLEDSIELHFASDHFLGLLLLDGKVLSNFTLETLQHVEVATLQIIEKAVDRFHDLNLEDKVLNWDGGIVMNRVQPNVDINVIQVVIGLTRAIGPRTRNRVRLIWDPG